MHFKYISPIPLGVMAISGTISFNAFSADALALESPWMFGGWNGSRQELADKGYTIIAKQVAETATNVYGGYDKNGKFGYADQFVLGTNINLEKVAGWTNAEFQLLVTDRNGADFTPDRLTDPRTGQVGSTMEVAGRGQIWRLSQMWYRQTYYSGKVDWKVGRGSPSEDFQDFPCDFQNLSFCSAQAGVWAGDDWYSFPVSVWGSRLKFEVAPNLYFQTGIYEHNRTELEHGNGFKLSTNGANGVMLPIEFIWKPKNFIMELPGEYRVGAYRINMTANDVYADENGNPKVLTGADPRTHSNRTGTWVIAKQQVLQLDGDPSRPIEVFIQAHANDKKTSFVDRHYSAGIIATGVISSRPKDQIAFALAKTHVNDKIANNEKLLNVSNEVVDYSDPAYTPVQHSEWNAELYYGVHATNWLTIRPNIQYIHNPGAVEEVDNAVVLGLKLITLF